MPRFVKHLFLFYIFFLHQNEVEAQYVYEPDKLSFEEKLKDATDMPTTGIHIGYQNVDTINQNADIIVQLYLPKKILIVLLRDFGIGKQVKSKNFRNLTMIFKGVSFKWDSGSHALASTDSLLQLSTIGGMPYDKPIAGGLELSIGSKFSRFSSLMTTSDSSQYFFIYKGSTSQMTVYSTDSVFMDAFTKSKYHHPFFDRKYKCNGMYLLCGSMMMLDKFSKRLEMYR